MKNLRRMAIIFVALLSGLLINNAFADVESVRGAVVEVAAPASVDLGALESDTEIKVFEEVEDLALPQDIRVDVWRQHKKAKRKGGKNRLIEAGTVVNSYLMHLDPVDQNKVHLKGCARFDTKVLGVIVRNKKLYATDAILGNPGTTYPTDVKARGKDKRDKVSIRKGRRVVCVNFRASPYMDQVRVLTEPNMSSGGGSADDNLVGHWMLDETSGTTAADSSPSDNDGTLMGNPVWTPGKIAGALALDGDGDGVMVADPEELHDLDTISVSMWFNANSLGQGNKGTFMAKDDSFAIRFSNVNHRVFFSAKRWDGGTGSWRFHTADNDSLLGGWHHLVITYDYSSDTNVPMAYLDGVLMDYENTAIPMPPVGSEAGDFVIGNDSSGNFAFDGLIDDVRVYSDILTADEVTALAN